MLSDHRLAQRAVGGDERAFAAIFDRYHQGLYRFCLAITGDPQDAQDALQNTMVKVLRALPGEERRIELKPWLYRIAHNESIELLRRRRETRELDPELAAPGSGLAEEAASRERLRLLLSDLDRLPERQRGALVMRELVGLDFAEIGAVLGASSAVARQTVYEARLSLRQMDEGREMSCATVTKALSDGDGRVTRRRDVRAHLRACADCRRFREEIEARERDLAALAPLPAVAAAGLLHGLLGGHSAGGGLIGALGGGAAKSLGVSTALKGAATVAVVTAIGVTAADRGGLIDAGLPGGGGSSAPQSLKPVNASDGEEGRSAVPTDAPVSAVQRNAAAEPSDRSLGSSRAAKSATEKAVVPSAAKTVAEAPAASTAQGTHPHSRGQEKQHPSASAHGQQTAATHKAAAHGTAPPKSHPAHPAKPSHPPHPSTPSSAKGPGPAPSSAASPEPAPSSAATHEPAPSNAAPHEPHAQQTPTAPPAEVPAGHETGKKP
jgi:RNA polymerase sigma factor (sigma-70 family)